MTRVWSGPSIRAAWPSGAIHNRTGELWKKNQSTRVEHAAVLIINSIQSGVNHLVQECLPHIVDGRLHKAFAFYHAVHVDGPILSVSRQSLILCLEFQSLMCDVQLDGIGRIQVPGARLALLVESEPLVQLLKRKLLDRGPHYRDVLPRDSITVGIRGSRGVRVEGDPCLVSKFCESVEHARVRIRERGIE